MGSQRKTIALLVDFTKEDLYRCFCRDEALKTKMGVARVHPEDNFCKETGRTVSYNNAKDIEFKIIGCSFEDDRVIWTLENKELDYHISLRTSKRSYKPHFINALIF